MLRAILRAVFGALLLTVAIFSARQQSFPKPVPSGQAVLVISRLFGAFPDQLTQLFSQEQIRRLTKKITSPFYDQTHRGLLAVLWIFYGSSALLFWRGRFSGVAGGWIGVSLLFGMGFAVFGFYAFWDMSTFPGVVLGIGRKIVWNATWEAALTQLFFSLAVAAGGWGVAFYKKRSPAV